jgi:hypothetical protein
MKKPMETITAATPAPTPQRLQGDDLRKALEEFRDTKDARRAEELKKIISYSICGA